MKRAIAVCWLVLMLLFAMSGVCAAEENLFENGGFELVDNTGSAAHWYPMAYRSQEGYSRLVISGEKARSGQYSAMVENAGSNDARFTYTVKVKPESLYRMSGYVFVESMEDIGNGANFGVEGIYSFSDGLFDTNGEWQYLEWYGETGEDQTELTLGVRVGGYGAESIGKAYFDDLVLEEVDRLPQRVIASLWYDANVGASYEEDNETGSGKSTALFVVLALLFAFAFWVAKPLLNRNTSRSAAPAFAVLLVLALLVRIFLAMQVEGYEVDINCFTAWSLRMFANGPASFYAPDYFCDYPPGAMLLLWPVGALLSVFGTGNQSVMLLIVKFLPIVCDLMGGILLYHIARKRIASIGAMLLSALYMLNPAVLVNGAAWGQMDSVLALLLLVTTVLAIKRCWQAAIPLFVISVLVKPQALLFAPVGGMALLFELFDAQTHCCRTKIGKQCAVGVLAALGASLLVILPFSVHQASLQWLFDLYGQTLGSYAYATLNTANLYYLFGANWAGIEQKIPMLMGVVPALAFAAGAVWFCLSRKNERIMTIVLAGAGVTALLMSVLQVSYSVFGYTMMGLVYALVILGFYRNRQQVGSLPFFMALSLIGVYVLGVKIHERYLFHAIPLLLVAYSLCKDRRLLWLCVGFSITTFINTAIVLDNSILFGASMGHLNEDTLLLNRMLCIANLLLCGFGGWIGFSGLKESNEALAAEPVEEMQQPESYRQMVLKESDHRLRLSLRDYLIMGTVTLCYSVLSFTNLGSTVAPQTAWVSTSADETVTLELEEQSKFSLLYYAGVSYNDFSISVSGDGINWSEPYPCQMREGLCYRWNYAVGSTVEGGEVSYLSNAPQNILWLDGKYLRVHAEQAGLNLWEVVARSENGQNLPLRVVSTANSRSDLLNESKPAEHLVDEINSCSGEPGWYNGTYFDEIYHARTGYEHLHGLAPYETTHPPLGKLLMSASIAAFGMTPFGWRFAGALVGVLMLPALYLLGMQLTRKRTVATVAMLAFALDLMHFTQTRIATIDSFPVLFILLTYFFMVRYMQHDFFAVSGEQPVLLDCSWWKSLIPLLLCGICMGLSIASKWIGIYSAVGLAVLFFLTVYRQYRASSAAWEMELETLDEKVSQRVYVAREYTLKRILITCGCCVVFFVLIPCAIYALCYVPYLAPTGPVTIKRIIDAQIGMLNYHSTPGLGMDHPFQSPWWQWPFILKPMWFAQDTYEPQGFASTIMCFGNPWVFYIGAFAMIAVLVCTVLKYVRVHGGTMTLRQGNGNLMLVTLSICFLVQYLPWVLVPRSMYIYHYFASVPFIILATAMILEWLPVSRRIRYAVMTLYITGAAIFFIMFFPYASGRLTSTEWLDAMKWFSKLYY